MENKYSYALVGAFVIGFILIILSISVWLTSGTEKINTIQYKLITDESVAGLSLNSQIDYRGVNVGKVTDISLDRNDPAFVTILLDIYEDTPIKQDTKAVLMGKGITGLVSVSLTAGTADAPPLLPTKDNPVPIIPNGPSLSKRLDEAFENVTVAVGSLSDQLSNVLTPENIDRFSQVAANIEKITSDLADATPEVKLLVADSRATINSAKDAIDSVRPKIEIAANSFSKIKEVIDTLKDSSENIDEFMASLKDIPSNVNATVRSWRHVANTADSQMRNVLPQLQSTLDKLSRFIDQLNENPNALLMGKAQGERGPGE